MSKLASNNTDYAYSAVANRNDVEDISIEETAGAKLGVRHLQVFLLFLLCFIAYAFRVSISVGIVAMTDPKATSNADIPTYPDWKDKNIIQSAFFWGYVIPQIFAGWAASTYGAKWFLIGTFTVQSLLATLVPYTAAQFGSTGLIWSRAVQGFCQGFVFPCTTHLLSQWVPPQERSRMGTIVYAANSCGTVVTIFVAGLISASQYGWPMIFYLNGILGFAWVLVMTFLGYNSPAEHPKISKSERLYIEKSLGHNDEKTVHPTPWRALITSWPLWALFATQTGNNYCFWTLLTQIPTYMNYIMHFDIKNNSLLSSLPYLVLWLSSFVVGFTSDAVINKGILSRTASRKVFNSLGVFIPAIALVLLGYTNSNQVTRTVGLLIAAVGSNAAVFGGFQLNHMDLSPNYAGTLMGICNGFSQITGAVAPLIVQLVVQNETDPLQWRRVFLITAAFNVITGIIFDIFGSGEVQPWNDAKKKTKNDDSQEL